MNKILPGDKAIRIGKTKVWLCEKEGCNEPITGMQKKYCFNHRATKYDKRERHQPKPKLNNNLHGEAFRMEFDEFFGILYFDLKLLSGMCDGFTARLQGD